MNQCGQCPQNCLVCNASDNCSQCIANQEFNNKLKQCVEKCKNCDQCPQSQYFDDQTQLCQDCDKSCKTCKFSSKNCTSCEDLQFLNTQDSKCIDSCDQPGYYIVQKNCLPCDSSCKTCSGSSKTCTSCKPDQFLNISSSSCIDYCPVNGFFIDQKSCVPCDASCSTCSGPSQCTTCATNLYQYGGNSLCKSCNESSIDPAIIAKEMQNCSQIIEKCLLNPQTQMYELTQICQSCQGNYLLVNNKCINKCSDIAQNYEYNYTLQRCQCSAQNPYQHNQPDNSIFCYKIQQPGYYCDQNKICKPCLQPNCQVCSNQQTCTVCLQGHYLWQNSCLKSCESNQGLQFSQSNKECICIQDYILYSPKQICILQLQISSIQLSSDSKYNIITVIFNRAPYPDESKTINLLIDPSKLAQNKDYTIISQQQTDNKLIFQISVQQNIKINELIVNFNNKSFNYKIQNTILTSDYVNNNLQNKQGAINNVKSLGQSLSPQEGSFQSIINILKNFQILCMLSNFVQLLGPLIVFKAYLPQPLYTGALLGASFIFTEIPNPDELSVNANTNSNEEIDCHQQIFQQLGFKNNIYQNLALPHLFLIISVIISLLCLLARYIMKGKQYTITLVNFLVNVMSQLHQGYITCTLFSIYYSLEYSSQKQYAIMDFGYSIKKQKIRMLLGPPNVCIKISNCVQCEGIGLNTCTNCDKNFALSSSTNCSTCGTGEFFQATNKPCGKCPENCKTCSSANICDECDSNFELDSTKNCQSCQPNGQYYDSKQKQCVNCPSNCLKCNSSSNCSVCSSGFQVTSQKNGCQACLTNQGQYYDSSQQICGQCSSQCLTCTSSKNCTECQANYQIIQNNCQACLINQGQYYDTSSKTCGSCLQNCLFYKYGGDNLCKACPVTSPQNTVSNCQSSQLQCLYNSQTKNYELTGVCSICNEGYTLSNNICVDSCSLITQNYYYEVSSSQCKCTSAYQYKYIRQNNSIFCSNYQQPGYFCDSNKICNMCKQQNCQTCPDQNTCTLCISGYYLWLNQCLQQCSPSQNLQISSSKTQCECIQNYTLISPGNICVIKLSITQINLTKDSKYNVLTVILNREPYPNELNVINIQLDPGKLILNTDYKIISQQRESNTFIYNIFVEENRRINQIVVSYNNQQTIFQLQNAILTTSNYNNSQQSVQGKIDSATTASQALTSGQGSGYSVIRILKQFQILCLLSNFIQFFGPLVLFKNYLPQIVYVGTILASSFIFTSIPDANQLDTSRQSDTISQDLTSSEHQLLSDLGLQANLYYAYPIPNISLIISVIIVVLCCFARWIMEGKQYTMEIVNFLINVASSVQQGFITPSLFSIYYCLAYTQENEKQQLTESFDQILEQFNSSQQKSVFFNKVQIRRESIGLKEKSEKMNLEL
ncbi:hypothetical protein ABPG74_020635 [Tetrahymena malaccensis]